MAQFFLHLERRGIPHPEGRDQTVEADLKSAMVETDEAARKLIDVALREKRHVADGALVLTDFAGRERYRVEFGPLIRRRRRG